MDKNNHSYTLKKFAYLGLWCFFRYLWRKHLAYSIQLWNLVSKTELSFAVAFEWDVSETVRSFCVFHLWSQVKSEVPHVSHFIFNNWNRICWYIVRFRVPVSKYWYGWWIFVWVDVLHHSQQIFTHVGPLPGQGSNLALANLLNASSFFFKSK